MKSIKNILVCGAGMMGTNIAFVMTSNPEYEVTLYDVRDMDVGAGIRENTKQLVEKGVISGKELCERIARVSFTGDMVSKEDKDDV